MVNIYMHERLDPVCYWMYLANIIVISYRWSEIDRSEYLPIEWLDHQTKCEDSSVFGRNAPGL